jgi:hypothetical protein
MQSASRKDKRQNVSSGSDPLAVLTANADCEINFAHYAGTGFLLFGPQTCASDVNKQAQGS